MRRGDSPYTVVTRHGVGPEQYIANGRGGAAIILWMIAPGELPRTEHEDERQ